MKNDAHRHVKKARAAAIAVSAAAIVATTGGTALAASTSSASTSHATRTQVSSASSTVYLDVPFTGNGVNIHANHSTSSTVRGRGYVGQTFDVTGFYGNNWVYGRDNNTGVWGWVLESYLGT